MNQETKQWLDMANMDMGVAKYLMENYHPKPLEIICYHCQQAAEKAIKALVVSRGTRGASCQRSNSVCRRNNGMGICYSKWRRG